MRETPKKHLEALLNFIYSGQTTIIEEDLAQFFSLAKSLQIDGLYKESRNMKEDNIEESPEAEETVHKTEQKKNTLDHKKQLDMDEGEERKVSNQDDIDFLDLTESDNDEDVSEIIDKYADPTTSELNDSFKNSELSNTSGSEYHEKISELIEKTESGLRCRECSFEKPRARAHHVRRHVEIHIKGFSFNCGYCGKTFSQNRSVRKHERKCREYTRYLAV